jgi:phosphocarrier protein HPr
MYWRAPIRALPSLLPSQERTTANSTGRGRSPTKIDSTIHKHCRAVVLVRQSPVFACPRPRPIEPPMSHETTVARRQVEVTNSLGLHMRPANKFVELALQFQAEIRVHYNGNEYNGKSILDLTSLAAECGTLLDLEARGPDAAAAVEALADLVSARFHEDENGDPTAVEPRTESAS